MVAGHDTLSARAVPVDALDLAHLVRSGTVARITMAALGRRIAASHADPEDIIGAVIVRLVEAQQSPRARYDPARGYSRSTYVWMVARSAGLNELRRLTTARRHEEDAAVEIRHASPVVEQAESEDAALDRILDLLDLEEERVMAWMLAEGHSLEEIRDWLGMSRGDAMELRTRVQALLMPLREG